MPHFPLSRAAILLSLLSAVAGCADGASYPSLASRPAERLNDSAPAAPPLPASASPAAPAPPSPELAARLEHLVDQARSAYRDFDRMRIGVDQLVSAAHGAPAGSEPWARATQALSGAQAARSLTAQPLADLDRIEVDDRIAHPAPASPDAADTPAADAQAIAQARDTVAALVAQEDTELAKLDGRLSG